MNSNCLLDSPAEVAGSIHKPAISGIFRVRLATDPWELRGYRKLRQAVFCEEQSLFARDDVDEHDSTAQPIVAVSSSSVADVDVVGTVRIHEASTGTWFGSRLAVDSGWRGVPNLAASLICKAVQTAISRGCGTFLANVQRQNVPLFRRLHWSRQGELSICGRAHCLMRADLDYYSQVETSFPAFTRQIIPRPA